MRQNRCAHIEMVAAECGAVQHWSNLVPSIDQVEPDLQHHLIRQGVVDASLLWYPYRDIRRGVAIVLTDRSMLV